MHRLTSLSYLAAIGLAITGMIVACRSTTPGEIPPLAPRPERIEPPSDPGPQLPTDPIVIPGGTADAAPVSPREPVAAAYRAQIFDGGIPDVAIPDAAPDAPEIPDASVDAAFASPGVTRDAEGHIKELR